MKKRVLIIRLDAIGDYILFRNVFRFIRNSRKYNDAEITLFGNPAWRQIAETYDADCADHWIWAVNRNDLFRKPFENILPEFIWHNRVRKVQSICRKQFAGRFDEILSLQPFRDPLLDELVAGLAPTVVNGWKLPQGTSPFVFLRNRAIASAITGETCTVPFELHLKENEAHAFYFKHLSMFQLDAIKFDECFKIARDFILRNEKEVLLELEVFSFQFLGRRKRVLSRAGQFL